MTYPIGHHKLHDSTTLTDSYKRECEGPFTREDLEAIDDVIKTSCGYEENECLALPGLAHVRNKIAIRLSMPLITTGEE